MKNSAQPLSVHARPEQKCVPVSPPLARTFCPVIQRASSLASCATTSAMSCGWPSRRHNVDGDVLGTEFFGEDVAELLDGSLRGDIGCIPRQHHGRGGRGQVNDPSALGHSFCRLLETAEQVTSMGRRSQSTPDHDLTGITICLLQEEQ